MGGEQPKACKALPPLPPPPPPAHLLVAQLHVHLACRCSPCAGGLEIIPQRAVLVRCCTLLAARQQGAPKLERVLYTRCWLHEKRLPRRLSSDRLPGT